MGELMINELDQTVQIRGIRFPVDHIRAAMIETGGIVVANEELNAALDNALYQHTAMEKKPPDMLFVEKEPGMVFIPKKVVVLSTTNRFADQKMGEIYLYFATRRKYRA